MIDAGVTVRARVDIYGPCSGSACSGLGGPPQARTKPQGPTGSAFTVGRKMGVIANGSNMPFNPNSTIYGSRGICLCEKTSSPEARMSPSKNGIYALIR